MRIRTIAEFSAVLLLVAFVGASTAEGANEPGVVEFVAAGDFAQTTATGDVLNGMNAADPDFALALGDLSYGVTGQEQAWCDFVTPRVGAGFPFELISGNHESNGQNGNI